VRPKRAKRPENRPTWSPWSLYGHIKSTGFFEMNDPDAFVAHFFNGLLHG
jgi:hypothetical protein